MNTYRITFAVAGKVTIDIDAHSEEAAMELANIVQWDDEYEYDLDVDSMQIEKL